MNGGIPEREGCHLTATTSRSVEFKFVFSFRHFVSAFHCVIECSSFWLACKIFFVRFWQEIWFQLALQTTISFCTMILMLQCVHGFRVSGSGSFVFFPHWGLKSCGKWHKCTENMLNIYVILLALKQNVFSWVPVQRLSTSFCPKDDKFRFCATYISGHQSATEVAAVQIQMIHVRRKFCKKTVPPVWVGFGLFWVTKTMTHAWKKLWDLETCLKFIQVPFTQDADHLATGVVGICKL